jgi:hypothetical protein
MKLLKARTSPASRHKLKLARSAGLCLLAGALIWTSCGSNPAPPPQTAQQPPAAQTPAGHAAHTPAPTVTPRIPAFHASAEAAKPLPRILAAEQFSTPYVAKAYRIAARIPEVLAQQPCYCYCDDGFGHGSLVDCFADDHGAG